MTGYYITVGYNSGWKKDKVAEKLLEVVKWARSHPEFLIREVFRVEQGYSYDHLESYAEVYRELGDDGDLTIQIKEDEDSEEKLPIIVQYASGGDPGRGEKEVMRRAFCRLVMTEMHKEGMEVNINVH